MQLNNWMAQQGAGNNVVEDVGENAAVQKDTEIQPQWGEWPAPPPPAPYNFQESLASEELQVQDGILPSNNLQDSPYASWNDSVSQNSSATSSDLEALVLVPVNILQALQRNGSLNFAANALTPTVQQNDLMIYSSFEVQTP